MNRSAAASIVGILVLAGCAVDEPWDGQGVVTNREYDDPDEWTTDGPCMARNDDGWCTSRAPDTHHSDEAHWYVQVTSTDGREHRIEVSQQAHDRCRLGAQWLNEELRCRG